MAKQYANYLSLTVLVILLMTPLSSAYANKGGLGISLGKELYIDDSPLTGELGQLNLNLYAAYYLNPAWSLSLAFDADLEHSDVDPIDLGLSLGTTYIFYSMKEVSPYLKGEGLFVIDPERAFGFRAGPGVRWELFRLLGTEGTYLFYQASIKGLYEKTDAPFYSVEWIRLGFEYYF